MVSHLAFIFHDFFPFVIDYDCAILGLLNKNGKNIVEILSKNKIRGKAIF